MTLAATDIDRIKAAIGDAGASSDYDTELTKVALAVSSALEGPELLNRSILKAERTELYTIPQGKARRVLSLRQAPVDADEEFEVKCSSTPAFDTVTALPSTEYALVPTPAVLHMSPPVRGLAFVQVRYTAGLAADLDALAAAYPQVVEAATLWAVQWWQRRTKIDRKAESRSGSAGTTTTFTEALGAPPPVVRTLIASLRRVTL